MRMRLFNHSRFQHKKAGFTLIELSIVLVIIGLIIGGILTGQDLINAAAERATIAQIEHYNTAVRTFQGKYGYLPGDIPNPYASNFGFQSRGTSRGEGDGNGILEGIDTNGETSAGIDEAAGEAAMVWVDLSTANLIDGTFNTASTINYPSGGDLSTAAAFNLMYPAAKIGGNNYVYVFSGGSEVSGVWQSNGTNYFAISNIQGVRGYGPMNAGLNSGLIGLTVKQAYDIDKKTDDGFPQSGRILAQYVNGTLPNPIYWATGQQYFEGAFPGTATSPTQYTCYDNGHVATAAMNYSLSQNGGAGLNCGLAIQLQ